MDALLQKKYLFRFHMSLSQVRPTVPCLHHERYLLRKDRQGIPSCKIETYAAQPWQALPTARMALPPSRPSPPTSGTSTASRKSSRRPWATGRRPSSSSLAQSPRESQRYSKGSPCCRCSPKAMAYARACRSWSSCGSPRTTDRHGSPSSRMRKSSTTKIWTRKRKYERSWRKRSNGRTTMSLGLASDRT